MALTPEDRQYLSLLSHLRQPKANLPLETLRSALPYYLSRLPIEHVTTLTATVLASGYWLPVSVEKALTLGTIFEHSLLLRHKKIEEEKQNAIFSLSRSISSQLRSWIEAVMRGASAGNQLLRVYIYGGVISAIRYLESSDEDLKSLDTWPTGDMSGTQTDMTVHKLLMILSRHCNSGNYCLRRVSGQSFSLSMVCDRSGGKSQGKNVLNVH
jgi:hypothetical protein